MRFLISLVVVFVILGCSSSDENENCNFLLPISVNETINLSLPFYSQLQFAGNSVYIPNLGNGGIIVASTGADFYAWDASDPNHAQTSCSVLVNSGLNATCGCDDKNEYSLVNGQPLNNGALPCGLRNYRVEQTGTTLRIYN
ncbi:hypothetical protein [Aestuariivivens sediminicola]|uniref:hypothetical protein n=1 Tax=Aestuariivivens sediminicola TaxID=2913560 RepID=UPI001F55ECCA|nr:hypothetical protein [Aestuariivivens sediminicola]